METGILKFCTLYNKKLENDKDIEDNEVSPFEDYRDRIHFKIVENSNAPGLTTMHHYGYTGNFMFTLDADDLKYLYNKYSCKMKEEMENNIKEVEEKYKDAL